MREGRKEAKDHNEELKKFHEKMRTLKCFATDDSKLENKPFVGFAETLVDISDGISWEFRIAKLASTFTAEPLAIGETLEIIEKIGWQQNFVNFSDSESVLKEISNTPTMNNTSHITQMLKGKIERQESRRVNPILLDPALWS
jgi:hypothetical protein